MRGRDRRIARAHERQVQHRRRRLVLLGVGGGAAVALLVIVGVLLLRPDDDDGELTREGSRPVTEEEAAAAPSDGDAPTAYRITYRLEHRQGATRYEEVTVRRPFDARTIERTEPDGGDVVGMRESSLGRFALKGGEGEDAVVLVQSAVLSAGDLRLEPVRDAAVERGLLEPREQREVAGRTCQVYRAATSVLAGQLTAPEGGDEYADACFDHTGLLLEEWWVVDGQPLRHRVAIDVEVEPDLGRTEAFDQLPVEPSIPPRMGGGVFRRIRDDSFPPETHYELPDAPAGFDRLGRFLVVPTQPGAFEEGEDRSEVVASVADVWTRGPDFVTVEQGGTLGQVAAFSPVPGAEAIEVGDWVTERDGEVELILGLVVNEIRVRFPLGRFVRIMGTLPPDELLDIARRLEPIEGGEILFDDIDELEDVDGFGGEDAPESPGDGDTDDGHEQD